MEALKHFVEVKRGSFSPKNLPDDPLLLSRFQGCLAGALAGDCLGYFYETPVFGQLYSERIDAYQFLSDLDAGLKIMKKNPEFTDDTVFTVALAKSLLDRDGFDDVDFIKKYVAAWKKYPGRGYGLAIGSFCRMVEDEEFRDPCTVARKLFNGSGSFGNGAAMRISPIALLYFDDLEKLVSVAEECGKTTHGHRLGYHGAVLLAVAIRLAMHAPPESPVAAEPFLEALKSTMAGVEDEISNDKPPSDRIGDWTATVSYVAKLDAVKELLEIDASKEQICQRLGVKVSAHKSVPTAIYCFLRGQTMIKGFNGTSAVERTIALALSLGGDTDTIGSMAAAISGAHQGIAAVPKKWLKRCEAPERSLKLAEKLYFMYKRHNNAKPKHAADANPRFLPAETTVVPEDN